MGFDTSEFDVNDLVTFLQSLDSSRRKLLSKTYLRSTTGDSRLNHLMMLHVHKDRTDALTRVDVANDFVIWQIFRERYPKQILYFAKSTQMEN